MACVFISKQYLKTKCFLTLIKPGMLFLSPLFLSLALCLFAVLLWKFCIIPICTDIFSSRSSIVHLLHLDPPSTWIICMSVVCCKTSCINHYLMVPVPFSVKTEITHWVIVLFIKDPLTIKVEVISEVSLLPHVQLCFSRANTILHGLTKLHSKSKKQLIHIFQLCYFL